MRSPSGYPGGGVSRSPRRKGFPRSLAELNSRFATWGATFTHAWTFDEPGAGDTALDLATSGAVNLVSVGNAEKIATGYPGGDIGSRVQPGVNNYSSPNANDLEVTTTDFVFLLDCKITDPDGGAFLWRKFSGSGSKIHRCIISAAGTPTFQVFDGATAAAPEIAVDHRDGAYHTLLFVVDRQTATKVASVTSDLGSATATAPTGSLSAAAFEGFQIGNDVDAIVTFAAWGLTPGTLHTNRVAAVAAWRRSIGAS